MSSVPLQSGDAVTREAHKESKDTGLSDADAARLAALATLRRRGIPAFLAHGRSARKQVCHTKRIRKMWEGKVDMKETNEQVKGGNIVTEKEKKVSCKTRRP